jgi:outer membrane protein TolC
MNRSVYRALFFSFIAMGAAMSAHADTLTLEQALDEGREHSPEVQRVKAIYDQSRWKKLETLGSGFLPKLSASGVHYINQRYQFLNINFAGAPISFPEVYPESSGSLDVALPLFDGFSNVIQYQAAALAEDAAENNYTYAEFQVEQQIRLAFYQALAAAILDDVAQQNVKTLEDHLNETQVLKHGGALTSYDVLRVQVQLTEAQTDAIDAKDNVASAREKLNQLLGLDQDSRTLRGELPVPHADLVKDLVYKGIPKERTDILALDQEVSAAEKSLIAKDLWLVPRVSLGADYTYYNNADQTLSSTSFQHSYNVGVYLSWNLFDGGVAYAQSREAAYQKIQVEKSADETRLKVPYDFDFWRRSYLSNSSRYLAHVLDVQRSEESVRLAKLEQKAGTRTSTEVLDAELDLFRSKAGVVNAQSSAAEAEIRLESAMGRKL